MMRKLLVSMTLICLVVLSTTSLSYGKEQKQEAQRYVPCILWYTYEIDDPFHGKITKTDRIDLGLVLGNGFGAAICEQRAQTYIATHYRDIDTGI